MKLIYGAGGHGRVLLDTLRTLGQPPDGFIDDGDVPPVIDGIPVFTERILDERTDLIVYHGVGYIGVRRMLAAKLKAKGIVSPTVIHPTAWVSPSATIGPGTVIYAGVVVNTGAVVGEGVILNTGCVVEHDVQLGDWCHISPNATLGGAAQLGEAVWAGMGSTVLPLITIGPETILGANAVATRHLPGHSVAVGIPAKVIKAR